MKAILILVVIVAAMAFLGWVTFSSSDDGASMTIDTQEMKEDTEQAVEKGKQAVRELRDGPEEGAAEPDDEHPQSETAEPEEPTDADLHEPSPANAAPADSQRLD